MYIKIMNWLQFFILVVVAIILFVLFCQLYFASTSSKQPEEREFPAESEVFEPDSDSESDISE